MIVWGFYGSCSTIDIHVDDRCTIAVNFSIVQNLNPFLYLVGVSKFDSFNTWIALHVTPIPLKTPLKQTKAPELKFNISNSDTTV